MSDGPSSTEQRPIVEPPAFAIRDFLAEKGFVTGDFIGNLNPDFVEKSNDRFGIFVPSKETRGGLKRLLPKPRANFFGEIELHNYHDEPELKDADWILSVNGRSNIETAKSLATQLSQQMKKKIGVYLKHEEEKLETRPGDFEL